MVYSPNILLDVDMTVIISTADGPPRVKSLQPNFGTKRQIITPNRITCHMRTMFSVYVFVKGDHKI